MSELCLDECHHVVVFTSIDLEQFPDWLLLVQEQVPVGFLVLCNLNSTDRGQLCCAAKGLSSKRVAVASSISSGAFQDTA